MRGRNPGRAILVLAVFTMMAFTAFTGVSVAATGVDASVGNTPAGGSSAETVTDCRQINESGTYELGTNITADATEVCVFVNASDVVFDGNGHWLKGAVDGGAHGYPILVQGTSSPTGYNPDPLSNVTLRNVRVVNWSQPVKFDGVDNATVVDSVLRDGFNVGGTRSGNGLQFNDGSNATVVETRVTGFPGRGVELRNVANATILRTAVVDNGYQGIFVSDGNNNTIHNSTIVGNAHNSRGGNAIQSDGPLSGLTITDNNVSENSGNGVRLGNSEGGLIANNTVNSNNHGIWLHDYGSGNNTIRDNTVVDNYRVGIYPRVPSTLVEDNRVVDSGSHGINFRPSINGEASHGIARNNTVLGSDSSGIVVNSARNVTLRENRVANSSDNGLKLQGTVPKLHAVGNRFRNNTRGISVETNTASGTIERNGIVNNSQWGLHFLWDSVPTLRVTHNIISDNGDPGINYRQDDGDPVSARNNWWGDPSGPSSASGVNLTDPVTGAVANGTGDSVSKNGSTQRTANVRFDPWLTVPPTVPFGTDDPVIVTDTLPTSESGEFPSTRIEVQSGGAIASFTVVNGSLPQGLKLHDDGVVNGSASEVGNFTFTVQVTDSENATANRTLTKDVRATVPKPSIDIEKIGTGATPGRTTLYLIRVENTGNTVARDVPVNEYLEPWWAYRTATPTPENVTSTVIRNGTSEYVESLVETNGTELNFTQDITQTTLSWTFDELRPGESRLLTYQVRLDSRIPNGFTVRGEACSCTGGCCENYNRCKEEVVAGCKLPGDLGRGSTVYDCLSLDAPGCGYGLFGPDPEELCNELGNKSICQRDYEACRAYNELKPSKPPCDEDEQNATTPSDPNEKVVGAERYIRPNRTLPYAVHYENVGNATATNVTVTDRIPDELDLSTVTVFTANRTRAGVNETTPVPLLRRNVTRTRNVTVGNRTVTRNETVQERHTAALDDRTLRWTLENTDLPPNGTGTLLMEATPKQGLADGTRIENNATIEFDEVSSLTTNNTVNVIDTTAPSCTVDPLPARSGRDIRVSWSGSDPVGEIEDVTIYVSTDGETWEIAEVGVENETVGYDGEFGETYRFMCVAADTAGNTESQSPQPEAQTSVTAVDVSGRVLEADGDPAANDTVAIGDGDPSTAPVVINAWNGTTCRLLQFDSVEPTDRTGRLEYVTDIGGTESLSYYQAPPSAFPQGNGTMADDEVAFPRDGSPDLYGLDRFSADDDRDLGNVTLPPGHPLNVTVVTEDGVPVENATVKVEHTGVNDSTAAVIFPRATNGDGLLVPDRADEPGVEVTGSISVTVRVPNETRLAQRLYTRNLTVGSARDLTVEVNVTERQDTEPPVIERFESARDTGPVNATAPTTVTVALADENPANATLAVRNESNVTVLERDVSDAFDTTLSIEWNGTNATGAPLVPGEYDLVLTATDTNGNDATATLSTVVDRGTNESDEGDEEDEEDEESDEGDEEDEESDEGDEEDEESDEGDEEDSDEDDEEDQENEDSDEDEEDEASEGETDGDDGGNGGSGGNGNSGGSVGGGSSVGSGNLVGPEITVDAAVESRLVAPSEPLTVTATVQNTGTAAGEYDLSLSLDGEATGEGRTGDLAPSTETTLRFRSNVTEPGVYDLRVGGTDLGSVTVLDEDAESVATARLDGDSAVFETGSVESVSAPGQSGVVSIAERSTLPATAPTLDGTLLASFQVGLPDADSEASVRVGVSRAELTDAGVAPADVRVLHYAPGSGEWDRLSVQVAQDGEDRVTYAVDGVASTLAIVAPVQTEPTATDTTTPTTEQTPEPVTEPAPAADPASDPGTTEPATTTGATGPGFGLGALVVALVLVTASAWRRVRQG